MNKVRRFSVLGGVLSVALVIALIVGWIKNIDKLSDCDFEAPVKCEVMHGVGLIPVVGAFTGWMDFGK